MTQQTLSPAPALSAPRRTGDRLVVAKAPLRVSLAGGGTDLPSYADSFGGEVVSLAIDRYVCVSLYPRSFDRAVHASWEYTETTPSADMLQNRFGRAALLRHGVTNSLQVASFADAPSGTGLGGSGAFTVALLHALHLRGGGRPDRAALAEEASAVEMTDLGRVVGKHDHYMAALGGLRLLRIGKGGQVRAENLPLTPALRDYFTNRLLLFYTGQSRDAGQVLAAQARQTESGQASTLEPLHVIRSLTGPMLEALRTGQVDRIGPLLREHWEAKTRLSDGVTTARVDQLYQAALRSGADGGKLLGAGGGGFILVSCRPGSQGAVRAAMAEADAPELAFGPETAGTESSSLAL
ncbi:hypothetical protein ACFU5N_29140 [Streptomyces albidoflavus]